MAKGSKQRANLIKSYRENPGQFHGETAKKIKQWISNPEQEVDTEMGEITSIRRGKKKKRNLRYG